METEQNYKTPLSNNVGRYYIVRKTDRRGSYAGQLPKKKKQFPVVLLPLISELDALHGCKDSFRSYNQCSYQTDNEGFRYR